MTQGIEEVTTIADEGPDQDPTPETEIETETDVEAVDQEVHHRVDILDQDQLVILIAEIKKKEIITATTRLMNATKQAIAKGRLLDQ